MKARQAGEVAASDSSQLQKCPVGGREKRRNALGIQKLTFHCEEKETTLPGAL